MAAPKRTKFERERDLERISAMYLQGYTQTYIAEEIGVSQPVIYRDLDEVKKRWRESSVMSMTEAKARELERIDVLENTYWDAWRRSNEERTKTRTSATEAGKAAFVEKETLIGEKRYLEGVQWCIEQRCKILGILAPVKQEMAGPDGGAILIRVDR
jgi:hypothetical protein